MNQTKHEASNIYNLIKSLPINYTSTIVDVAKQSTLPEFENFLVTGEMVGVKLSSAQMANLKGGKGKYEVRITDKRDNSFTVIK